jgi:Flp pilus assembly protein TadG
LFFSGRAGFFVTSLHGATAARSDGTHSDGITAISTALDAVLATLKAANLGGIHEVVNELHTLVQWKMVGLLTDSQISNSQ